LDEEEAAPSPKKTAESKEEVKKEVVAPKVVTRIQSP